MVFNVEGQIPDISSKDWRLSVNGMVENPVDLTLKQLQNDFTQVEVESNILCLRGVTIKGLWAGVPASSLLSFAEAQGEASWVHIKAYSNFSEPIGFKDLAQEGVLIAHTLNDLPIPPEQGGALRLIVPEKYAYKSVKWLNELTVLAEKPEGFWEKKGYPEKDER